MSVQSRIRVKSAVTSWGGVVPAASMAKRDGVNASGYEAMVMSELRLIG